MEARAQQLHTYFLFPFSVDKEAVMEDHQDVWAKREQWIDGLDEWIASESAAQTSELATRLGRWHRDPYRKFDMEAPAYQDMVFFHPFVRRVFFDTAESMAEPGEMEALLRCYRIPLNHLEAGGARLLFEAEDAKQRRASVQVTDLRLFLFANGIGILTIGVQAFDLPIYDALWINEMMRKVYPSSGRQLREGRTPHRVALVLEQAGGREILLEEGFERCVMRGYLPPLSRLITGLLYFANYATQEFEPVLDERMIVFTYVEVDPASVPANYHQSEDYEILFSRLLYVDRFRAEYRYESEFTRALLRRDTYRRWAQHGTLYGFTSYSNVTMVMGQHDCGEHQLAEGFLVHRMFATRYYLMVVIALFYRATLLDFSERTALVSRRLFRKYSRADVNEGDILVVGRLMAEFQHFSNYWYFSELANKDEEIEHFQMQCAAFRLEGMKNEIEQEIEKLNDYLERIFQLRNTESINRLAMLSMILGGGAMVTGYFGMNFGRAFDALFFNPSGADWMHRFAVGGVSVIVVGSLLFGVYLVAANWADYRSILLPGRLRDFQHGSLRRTSDWKEEEDAEE